MAEGYGGRAQLIGRTIAFGLLSAALYAAVFVNQGTVMQYFTKGGVYAAMPITTVFLFSFVHGAFTSNIWSLFGIEARKKDVREKRTEQPAYKKKRPRLRLRMNA